MASPLGLLSAEPYGSLDQQRKSSPFVVLPPKDASEREERRYVVVYVAHTGISPSNRSVVGILLG